MTQKTAGSMAERTPMNSVMDVSHTLQWDEQDFAAQLTVDLRMGHAIQN